MSWTQIEVAVIMQLIDKYGEVKVRAVLDKLRKEEHEQTIEELRALQGKVSRHQANQGENPRY